MVELIEELVPPGIYETVKKETVLEDAAIVSLTKDDYVIDEGGTFNHDTRKLYCYHLLEKGDLVVNQMNNGTVREYKVIEHLDKSDHEIDGLHIYYLERSGRDD